MSEGYDRCFVRACQWNTDEVCEKPVDAPCPLLWLASGVLDAGKGVDMKRRWRYKVKVMG